MSSFSLDIHFNNEGWGPKIGESVKAFEGVPYAHFDKKERLFRHADNFNLQNQSSSRYQRPRPYRSSEDVNAEFSYKYDNAEDSSFKLVDTAKTQHKSRFTAVNRRQWNANARNRNFQSGNQGNRGQQQSSRGQKNWNNRRRQQNKVDRLPSLTVKGDWVVVEEIDLAQLNKLQANKPTEEDLTWCGHLDQYNDAYDKTSSKATKPLRRCENKLFYSVTTTDDPVIENFAVEGTGNVFATDAIIAQLMAASRSVYSWDIVIQKMNGMLFLDKRENSSFDLLTVSETAYDPPSPLGTGNEEDDINLPDKLSVEATMINHSFSQQVLKKPTVEGVRKNFEPNPFFEDEEDDTEAEPASVAYRYRKFTMGDIRLIVRCELHAWTTKRGEDLLMTCHALNEWDSKFSGGIEWRQKIDQQRGAVLATELKNNSCKLGRWAAQSILAGADLMKLGYVSRNVRTNPYEHQILATQYFKPKDLAVQIAMTLTQMWGVIKMICELMMREDKEDGKYVILKDPNKPIVRLYSVPPGTFESDDESDEDESGNDSEDDN